MKYILALLLFTLALFANIPPQITYDEAGNITQIETPQTTITKTYDALNRLKTVTDAQGTVTYDYDAIGRQTKVTYPNGITTNYSYDNRNRIVKIEHKASNGTVLQSFTYILDAVGNRTQIVEHTGRTVDYTYNTVHQLTKEVVSNDPNNHNTTTTFSYDAVGNLLTKKVDDEERSYEYNANDQLSKKGSTTYTYDANGNLISDGTNSYSYDDKNRVVKVTTPTQTVEYAYDANDNRIAKTTNDGTTTYLVDANTPYAQVITETKESGTSIEYTYGNDLVSQNTAVETLMYLTDALGSTRALADSTGNITDNYTYSPYGALLEHLGNSTNEFLFTGEQYGFEDELYYLRARYYSPNSTRFLSRDTYDGRMLEPISQNHYLYTGSNPINYIDPSGHMLMASMMLTFGITDIQKSQKGVKLTYQVYGKNGLIKTLACGAGVSFIKRQYREDGTSYGLHGHHPISVNLGGKVDQDLIFLPAHTHEMFHWVLDLFLKVQPELKGKGNWTSKDDWEIISETKEGRKAMYKAIYLSSYVVDNVCKLKGRRSLRWYVKKYKKDFIGGKWND